MWPQNFYWPAQYFVSIQLNLIFWRMFRFIHALENFCAARNRNSGPEQPQRRSHLARRQLPVFRWSPPSWRPVLMTLPSRLSPASSRATLDRRSKPIGPSRSLAGSSTNESVASSSETSRSGSSVTSEKIFRLTRYFSAAQLSCIRKSLSMSSVVLLF